MGAMADAALAAGGQVIGVIPSGLFPPEEIHPAVDVVETDSLHHRKQVMLELADAFVVLPGGLGTLDEVGEVLTWAQLGIHAKVDGVRRRRRLLERRSSTGSSTRSCAATSPVPSRDFYRGGRGRRRCAPGDHRRTRRRRRRAARSSREQT